MLTNNPWACSPRTIAQVSRRAALARFEDLRTSKRNTNSTACGDLSAHRNAESSWQGRARWRIALPRDTESAHELTSCQRGKDQSPRSGRILLSQGRWFVCAAALLTLLAFGTMYVSALRTQNDIEEMQSR